MINYCFRLKTVSILKTRKVKKTSIGLEKHFFKDSNVPIDRSYHDRLPGEECTEATDWEYDEVSSDED